MNNNNNMLEESSSKNELELHKVKLELAEQKRLLQECENKQLQEKFLKGRNYLTEKFFLKSYNYKFSIEINNK